MVTTRRLCDTDSLTRSLKIDLALVDGVRPGDPIQEELAGTVVDLVLQRAGLEGVGGDRDRLPRPRQDRLDHDPSGPLHVAGQIRYRHAALAPGLPPAGLDDLRVAEH